MEFSKKEMTRRLETVRAQMDAAGIDCLLITGLENFCYFVGVHASLYQTRRPWCAVIPLRSEPVAVMREGWVALTLKRNGFFQNVVGYEFPVSREVPPKIADALKACGARRVGCEFGLEMRMGLPLDDFNAVRRLVSGVEFVDGSSIIWRMRMTKSSEEVARMRKACEITTAARREVFARVRPGMTEYEVAELWADLMHEAGAERPSFIYINTGTIPDLLPSRDKVLQRGETLWLDGGAYVGGYTCDFSRVASLGPTSARQRQLNRDAVEVMDTLLEHVRPGVPVADLAALAAKEKARRGFATQHGRARGGAGHSMGMLINEPPMIAPWDDTVLTPGLVIGLELGPVEPEGMFITEELLQVTEAGYDRLTAEPPTLVELDS
jgi:Xaa-Pro aminopeptidase